MDIFAPPRGDGILRQYCCLYDASVVTMPCQARQTKEKEEVVVVVGQTPLSSGRPRTLASVCCKPIRSRGSADGRALEANIQ